MYPLTIGICCIGSGVGQSVVTSCKLSKLPFRTIGLGTNPFAFGAYECDRYDFTPSFYDPEYLEVLLAKCGEHGIRLLIPGHDDEALFFARNYAKFAERGIEIVCSSEEVMILARDKELMSRMFGSQTACFVRSFNLNEVETALSEGVVTFPLIAKPKGGFASRGIRILNGPEDLKSIPETHIVQELAVPCTGDPMRGYYLEELAKGNNPQVAEVSIQYVTDRSGHLIGKMMTYNKLNNGVPIEVMPYDSPKVWAAAEKVVDILRQKGLRGPLNMQGRLTDRGFKIFEMNPRFTGITGLRAALGFNEVEAVIRSWMYPSIPSVTLEPNFRKFGIRQTLDKTVTVYENDKILKIAETIGLSARIGGKHILVTGANGFLGVEVVRQLCLSPQVSQVLTLTRNKTATSEMFGEVIGEVRCLHYDYQDLETGAFSLGQIDALVHCAFSRAHRGAMAIAESLSLTAEIFALAAMHQVPLVVNLSSQSVYGKLDRPPWNEFSRVSPETLYAQAKYATEVLCASLAKMHRNVKYVSLRLGALMGYEGKDVAIDLVTQLVRKAIKGETIPIYGGLQEYQRLDCRDAAAAVVRLVERSSRCARPVYNIGADQILNIKDLARFIIDAVKARVKDNRSRMVLEAGDDTSFHALDSTAFRNDFGWKPRHSISETIEWVIDGVLSEGASDI